MDKRLANRVPWFGGWQLGVGAMVLQLAIGCTVVLGMTICVRACYGFEADHKLEDHWMYVNCDTGCIGATDTRDISL